MLVGSLLSQAARRWPDRAAVKQDSEMLSYRQWNERVNGVARCMAEKIGIGKGDRVAVFAFNSLEMITAAFAIQKLGAVYVTINFRLAAEELRYQLEDADVKALFYDVDLAEVVGAAAGDVRYLVGLRARAGQPVPYGISFAELCGPCTDEPKVEIAESDASLIMYTSGTTGRPKGVVLSHRAQWINTLLCTIELQLSPEDRTLHMAPLFHVAAYHVMLLPHILVGGFNVILQRFDPDAALDVLKRERITTILGVPTQYDLLAERLQESGSTFPDLRLAVTTGAPIKQETAARIRERLTPSLCCVYGLTESTSLLCILPPGEWDRRPEGCIGRTLIGVETRVVTAQDEIDIDSIVALGSTGILAAKAPKLMDGYLHNVEKTAERIKDGWIITGDVVVEDEEGFFQLVDRYDDMIISAGENVYPQEVEQVLLRCPGIADCAVVGIADRRWGQAVTAFVVARDPTLTGKTLDAFCLDGRLARYKRPRAYHFVSSIPRNPSGKILRKILKQHHTPNITEPKEVTNG